MIKKFIFFVSACLSLATVNAQTALQTSKVFDNTYVGAEVGFTTPLSFNSVFPVNSSFGIKVGKNFTPVFGMNVEGITFFGSATNKQLRFSNRTAIRAINIGLNGTVDMFNLCTGYNPERKFTIIPEVGLGWFHIFSTSNSNLSAKTGIQAVFNIKNKWQLFVEPIIFWNLTHSEYSALQFNKNVAQIGIQVGFIYKFKTSNGTHNFKQYDIEALNSEINQLRSELNKKPREITKVIAKEITRVDTVYIEKAVIFFAKNSANLTPQAKEALNKIESSVSVYGYASPEGTSEYNQKLSEARANVVAKYLKSRGIKVIKVQGFGAENEASNRVVIVD